jgi:adenylate cyclase
MPGRCWKNTGGERPAVSAEFEHALMREVLRTELIRVKALIATVLVLTVTVSAVYFFEPEAVQHLWRGRMRPAYVFEILLPFLAFELWIHAVVNRHLKKDRDVPAFRRYRPSPALLRSGKWLRATSARRDVRSTPSSAKP